MTERSSMWKKAGLIGLPLIAVAAGLIVFFSGSAEVVGVDSAQRVESVVQLASERPRGAANALAETAAHDPDPKVRRAAVVSLAGFDRDRDRDVFEAATRDADPSVRQTAVKLLITAHVDRPAVDRAAEMIVDDPPAAGAAADALAASQDGYAIVRLVRTMETAPVEARPTMLKAVRDRYGIVLEVNCADEAQWAKFVTVVKDSEEVTAAFERVGEPLNKNQAIMQEIIADHAVGCHSVSGQRRADNGP